MKITRLRKGYRINLSDGEFEAMRHLVWLGTADAEDESQNTGLSASARRALGFRFGLQAAMAVDEDQR